jgi:putative membrane protein
VVSWVLVFAVVFIWSLISPADFLTWMLEVSPAVAALIILGLTYKQFPLTPLVYFLILFHCVILMVGGHYTYAKVPLFDIISEMTGSGRNNYDKFAHFFQGFVPAMIARELLIRFKVVSGPYWMAFIIVSICLAISALYELIEWMVAAISDTAAEAFLGTQGYEWDTQSDMALALLGACCALILLNRLHDRQLSRLP